MPRLIGRDGGGTRVVMVGGVPIGAGGAVVVAGPCAVESLDQMLEAAGCAKACGASILRAGAYKPRSSPYSFQGLGERALEMIRAAKEETGLPVVSEATGPQHLEALAECVDMIQIGARNMQNYELLKAVGRYRLPVLLKRGISATVEEWLMAAEYIALEGNMGIVLCERGIRTYETYTRNTLDLSAVAVAKDLTRLPVMVDPSHGTGRQELVIPMAKAALAAGADGIMVEMHPSPEQALSDGHQSLSPSGFAILMASLPQGTAIPRTSPDKDTFASLAACHDIVPVMADLHCDTITSAQGYMALGQAEGSFLLESVQGGDRLGRYSFVGADPMAVFTVKGGRTTLEDRKGLFGHGPGTRDLPGNPLSSLKGIFNGVSCAPTAGLPRFFGGAVGYLSYDMARHIENLPETAVDSLGTPDCILLFPSMVLAFDHVSNRVKVVYNAVTKDRDPAVAYAEAVSAISSAASRLTSHPPTINQDPFGPKASEPRANMTMMDYMDMVAKAREHIQAGDAFQVVLSLRFSAPFEGDAFGLYRRLRSTNPSPYTFHLNLPGITLVGASPEILVRLEDGRAELRPIAGTRKRGATPSEDAGLAAELLSDPKERAEHIMLVDLGRNDLGRVCKYGSVRVTDLMSIERYSHVMHIASGCTGELKEGMDQFDLLSAAFPAGTLTGAPKVRAMEIVDSLEPVKRGPYGGVVGYFGWNGNMDTCITIRTAVIADKTVHVQAGAGIVADSVPLTEYSECVNKAQALLTCLGLELAETAGGVR